MSHSSPYDRGKIDIHSLTGIPQGASKKPAKKAFFLPRPDLPRLEILKGLVGSDLVTRFEVPHITQHAPQLECNILGRPLGWTPEYHLLVEITQLRKGKHSGPRAPCLISPADRFIVHFYARSQPHAFICMQHPDNEAGDAIATFDGAGGLISLEVWVKKKASENSSPPTPQKRYSMSFREGQDVVELLKAGTPAEVLLRAQETCGQVLRTLQQQGRLQSPPEP